MEATKKPLVLVLPNGLADANTILAGLGELPAKGVYHLIQHIEKSVKDQLKEQEAPNVPVTDGA